MMIRVYYRLSHNRMFLILSLPLIIFISEVKLLSSTVNLLLTSSLFTICIIFDYDIIGTDPEYFKALFSIINTRISFDLWTI